MPEFQHYSNYTSFSPGYVSNPQRAVAIIASDAQKRPTTTCAHVVFVVQLPRSGWLATTLLPTTI